MFYLKFVWQDSSITPYFVSATDIKSAINTVLNNTKPTSNPKFVIVEQPQYFQSTDNVDLVRKFEEVELQGGDVIYKFESKTAETVTVNGITLHKGSFVDILNFTNWD